MVEEEERIFRQLHSHEKLNTSHMAAGNLLVPIRSTVGLDHLDPTMHKVEGPSIWEYKNGVETFFQLF